MTSALNTTAERTADAGEPSRMTFSTSSPGKAPPNSAGMIAKYFATSLAIENVVSAPRVMSSCLPIRTTSMSLVGSESRSTMLPASLAAEVPVFMATPTSACAGAEAPSTSTRTPGIANDRAVPVSTSAGVTRTDRAARVICRGPIVLPRYSGVRPTISPPTNTAITASTSIPYRPDPAPPGATSPSIMLSIGTAPPSALNESCMPFTAPVDVRVPTPPNRAVAAMPNRCSLPSIAPPAASGAEPVACCSRSARATTGATASVAIAARTAWPCRTLPTMRPKVRGSATGTASISTTWNADVHADGFSNGCAEFALKNPPPFVPSSLIASWEATGPPGTACVPPASVVTSVAPDQLWITPPSTSTSAATSDRGSRIRTVPRTRSTQKLPMVDDRRRANPRTSATATAVPTAADTTFCTTSPPACTVYPSVDSGT